MGLIRRLGEGLAASNRRAFAVLATNAAYRRYFLVSIGTQLGLWAHVTAQSWLVLELTQSGAMMGVLALCEFGPAAVFGLLGGVVVDRQDNRKLLLASLLVLALLGAVLTAAAMLKVATVEVVFAIAAANGLISCLVAPAAQTYAIRLAGRANVANTVGLGAARQHLARVIAPGLAGLAIAHLGVGICFAANAISLLGMGWVVYRTRLHDPAAPGARTNTGSPIAHLLEGLRYVAASPRFLCLAASIFLITFIPMSFGTTLPIFAVQTLKQDSTVFGLLFSCLGFGSVIGAMVVASRERIGIDPIFGGAAMLGLGQLTFILDRDVGLIAVTSIGIGTAMTVFLTGSTSILLAEAREAVLGRVSALTHYLVGTLGPLGSSLSGLLCEIGGTDLAFAVGGFIAVSVGTAGLLARSRLAPHR